jgi:hypothetical protein
MVGLSSWLWFGISAWYVSSGERYVTWLAIGSMVCFHEIILFFKVKVLRGGICAYGWVTILRYCLR